MKARDFDKRFETGEDIVEYLDLTGARRPGQAQKRVNVDFPIWMIRSLDKEAGGSACLDSLSSRFWWHGTSRDRTAEVHPLRFGRRGKKGAEFDRPFLIGQHQNVAFCQLMRFDDNGQIISGSV